MLARFHNLEIFSIYDIWCYNIYNLFKFIMYYLWVRHEYTLLIYNQALFILKDMHINYGVEFKQLKVNTQKISNFMFEYQQYFYFYLFLKDDSSKKIYGLWAYYSFIQICYNICRINLTMSFKNAPSNWTCIKSNGKTK